MFEREYAFYEAHKAEFREKHLNKWLVIAGDSLLGVFDTPKDAFIAAGRRYKPGEFMLHRPADDDAVIEVGPLVYDCRSDDSIPEGVTTVTDGELMKFTYA